jgi:alpha-galactosidase
VVAVNQDPLGHAGDVVSKQGVLKDLHVWAKKLHDGSYAACLLNMEIIQNKISAHFDDLGLPKGQKCVVRDLWEHKDMGSFTDSYTVQVPSQSAVMIRITPQA